MSDLTEALAWWDTPPKDQTWESDQTIGQAMDVIVAAARRWHTLEPHLNDLDSIVSLILHRHNIDPPLPFDERQRLHSAIGVIRSALTVTADPDG